VEVERNGRQFRDALTQISRVPIFQHLPPEDVEEIASRVFSQRHEKGYTFFHQNEQADRMYIIEHGEVALLDPKDQTRTPVTLGNNDAFGAMSFLTGARHAVTAVATTDATVWVLRKRDFDQLLEKSRMLAQAVQDFLRQEEVFSYLRQKQDFDPNKAARWVRQAVTDMEAGRRIPSASEMAATIKEHQGAPLAIWLGQLLDGIPGALVIGSSALHAHVSVSLLAGLFLSNYPASLSSSTGMQQQGFSFTWALGMWFSLMLISGVGAALGYLFFAGAPPMVFSFLEGTAVGAMMTVIAETMLPEAYLKGNSLVGFSTLLGFLAAVFFKTLE
jgi:CRP-like cAMP-binding protein